LNEDKTATTQNAFPSMTSAYFQKKKNARTVKTIERTSANNRNDYVEHIKQRQSLHQNSMQRRQLKKVEALKKAKQLNALKNCKIFEDLDVETRNQVVDKMELEFYDSGVDICKQGDIANLLYLIIVGSCQVFIDKKKVAKLNELSVFGESALFDINGVAKRGGTVTAVSDVQLLGLTKANFDYLVDSGALNEKCTKKLNQMKVERAKENKKRGHLPSLPMAIAKDKKDHIYFKKKLTKLGRSKLEVIFKRVPPIGDSKSIDRDGVLKILKMLQVNSAGKNVILRELGLLDGKKKICAVIPIEEFEKKVVSNNYRLDLFDDLDMPSLPIAGKRKKGKSSESKKREKERQEKRESGTSLADMMNDEEKTQYYLGNTNSNEDITNATEPKKISYHTIIHSSHAVAVAKDKKDHIYFKKELTKLGRSELEVIFKRVSPVGDSKSIDREGVLAILKMLQINSAGKNVVLCELGLLDDSAGKNVVLRELGLLDSAVIPIDVFEKKVVSNNYYRLDLFDDLDYV